MILDLRLEIVLKRNIFPKWWRTKWCCTKQKEQKSPWTNKGDASLHSKNTWLKQTSLRDHSILSQLLSVFQKNNSHQSISQKITGNKMKQNILSHSSMPTGKKHHITSGAKTCCIKVVQFATSLYLWNVPWLTHRISSVKRCVSIHLTEVSLVISLAYPARTCMILSKFGPVWFIPRSWKWSPVEEEGVKFFFGSHAFSFVTAVKLCCGFFVEGQLWPSCCPMSSRDVWWPHHSGPSSPRTTRPKWPQSWDRVAARRRCSWWWNPP